MISDDDKYLQNLRWHSLITVLKWIPSSVIIALTHEWMSKPWHCIPCQCLLNPIQPCRVIWIGMTLTDGIIRPDLVSQAETVILNYYKQWEHNIRIYCILNTEINIISLHRNKQDLESGIIQWWCRLLDENFHLVLMITCFTMQICNRVGCSALWSTPCHEMVNQHLPSKQTSERGGKAYEYNGFLNFFSTCSSAFWRLIWSSRSML